jgi:hypothetical protein
MVIGTLKKLLNEALKKVCLSICFSPSPHILLFVQNPSEIEKDPFLNHLDWSLPKGNHQPHLLVTRFQSYKEN